MSIKIRQSGKRKLEITPHIFEVIDGVYYVHISFDERVILVATGDGVLDGKLSIYFSTLDEQNTIEVCLGLDVDGLIFGEVSKSSYYGTYYSDKAYGKIVTRENEFLTGI